MSGYIDIYRYAWMTLIRQTDKHYTTFKTARHIAPAPGRQEEMESLSSIVLLFRMSRKF
jgi:hypothetical protein